MLATFQNDLLPIFNDFWNSFLVFFGLNGWNYDAFVVLDDAVEGGLKRFFDGANFLEFLTSSIFNFIALVDNPNRRRILRTGLKLPIFNGTRLVRNQHRIIHILHRLLAGADPYHVQEAGRRLRTLLPQLRLETLLILLPFLLANLNMLFYFLYAELLPTNIANKGPRLFACMLHLTQQQLIVHFYYLQQNDTLQIKINLTNGI